MPMTEKLLLTDKEIEAIKSSSPEEMSPELLAERIKCFNEMKAILGMVENWKKSYVTSAIYPGHDAHFPISEFMKPDGDWGFLVRELWKDCDEFIFPYAKRFQQCGYLSGAELGAFMGELQKAIYNFAAELIELYCEWWVANELTDAEREIYRFPSEEEFRMIWAVFAPEVLRVSLAGGV